MAQGTHGRSPQKEQTMRSFVPTFVLHSSLSSTDVFFASLAEERAKLDWRNAHWSASWRSFLRKGDTDVKHIAHA
jgi:hypothetical protein